MYNYYRKCLLSVFFVCAPFLLFADPRPEELKVLQKPEFVPSDDLRKQVEDALAPVKQDCLDFWGRMAKGGADNSFDKAIVPLSNSLQRNGFNLLKMGTTLVVEHPKVPGQVIKMPGIFTDDTFERILYKKKIDAWAYNNNLAVSCVPKKAFISGWGTEQTQPKVPCGGVFVVAKKVPLEASKRHLSDAQRYIVYRLVNEEGYYDPKPNNMLVADDYIVVTDTGLPTFPVQAIKRVAAFFLHQDYGISFEELQTNLGLSDAHMAHVQHTFNPNFPNWHMKPGQLVRNKFDMDAVQEECKNHATSDCTGEAIYTALGKEVQEKLADKLLDNKEIKADIIRFVASQKRARQAKKKKRRKRAKS